jgi:hypothetical protein
VACLDGLLPLGRVSAELRAWAARHTYLLRVQAVLRGGESEGVRVSQASSLLLKHQVGLPPTQHATSAQPYLLHVGVGRTWRVAQAWQWQKT